MATLATAPSPVTPKAHYDPIKAVEGMFNGSVTRIGYALKDPADYGGSTKTVLAECAKRYHDALDDCEIQLLDAKWYLEHQLYSNRLRREAQAREMGTAAKRKHDEIKEPTEQDANDVAASKKAKLDQTSEQAKDKEQVKPNEMIVEPKPAQVNGSRSTKQQLESQSKQVAQPEKKPDEAQQTQTSPNVPYQSTFSATKEQPAPLPPAADDFAKPTPQATPTGTNDDFNFESMFGDPTGDILGDTNKDDNDLNFDFTTGDMSGGMEDSTTQDPNSLDSLLPGLESYANQTDDNILNAELSNTNPNTNASNINNNNNNNTSNNQDTTALPSFSNDFDLPDIGGPNIFDDYLNDDGLGGVDIGGNFEDNIDLSDSALLDLDFDAFK